MLVLFFVLRCFSLDSLACKAGTFCTAIDLGLDLDFQTDRELGFESINDSKVEVDVSSSQYL